MAEAAGIFVSHAHEDNAWCRTFVEALQQGGASVWYDEHNLGYGVLGEEIERELRVRPIFIVILSPASVGKPWVRREMDAAMYLRDQNPERIILPVVAEKAELPLFWVGYKRVSGPGDIGIDATEAAGRVIHTLGIVAAEAPAAAPPPVETETAAEANTRGDGLYAQKRYAEALSAYERATTLEPGNAIYWKDTGNALADLGRYAEALSAIEQALILDPQSAPAWNSKGTVLYDLGRHDEALSAIEQALILDPQSAPAWNSKGVVLRRLSRRDEALSAYERALALDPKYADAWMNKIALLNRLGRPAEAGEAERQRDKALGQG
jgi:Flp pilus assembly protein TadD